LSAITSMVRHSTDQVVSAVKHRYAGPRAAGNIASDIKKLVSMLNVEDKHVDTLQAVQTVVNNSPVILTIGGTQQGTAVNQRSGDSLKVNKIDLLLEFVYSTGTPATATQQNQIYNWYLVRYLKTVTGSGTTPFGITEFLNVDGGGNTTPLSFPNTDCIEDFQIMAHGTVEIDLDVVATVDNKKAKVVSISHPCAFHQDYSSNTIASITDNEVFIVITALFPVNTGGSSTVLVQARTWFIDN
jgi:hypothetical protein